MRGGGNFAFIDSQNLNLAIQDQGWKLDFKRFFIYLNENYLVSQAFLCIGFVPSQYKLYEFLKRCGYTLIFKPTLEKSGETKGNIDAELVLHTMIQYPNFDKAIIVTGDGDFYCLIEYLNQQEKLNKVLIPNAKKYSGLLKSFKEKIDFIGTARQLLEYKKSPN